MLTPLNGNGEPITRSQGEPAVYPYTPPPVRGDGEPLGATDLDLDEEIPELAPSNEPTLHDALAVCHKELLTIAEAANYAKASTQTISHWLCDGDLPGTRFGQQKYISREDLWECLASKNRKPRGE